MNSIQMFNSYIVDFAVNIENVSLTCFATGFLFILMSMNFTYIVTSVSYI